MKKVFYFLTIAVFLCISCEEQAVVIPLGSNSGGGPIVNDTVYKTVLIEDFTGVRCPNCPNATIIIEDIRSIFGKERVVPVGVHGLFLTAPLEPGDTDLRSTYSLQLESFAAPASKPAGSLNRTSRSTPNGLVFWNSDIDEWPSQVEKQLLTPADMTVDFEFEFDETERKLDVHVTATGINDVNEDVLVSIFLTQNAIEAPQETNVGSEEVIEEYEHEHVLLGGLTDVKGDAFATSLMMGEELSKSFSMTLPVQEEVKWNVDNMEIVVFTSASATDRREVFYVKSKKIK